MAMFRNHLTESFIGFCSVLLMGIVRSDFSFKEALILYFMLMVVFNYLFFIKQSEVFDIFDLLFPQMTIFQIKTILMDNFFTNITFLECGLISLFV